MDHVAPPPHRIAVVRCLISAATVIASLAVIVSPTPAHAQTATDPAATAATADAAVAALRSRADALAGRYFEALANVGEIQQKADEIEAKLPGLRAETQ